MMATMTTLMAVMSLAKLSLPMSAHQMKGERVHAISIALMVFTNQWKSVMMETPIPQMAATINVCKTFITLVKMMLRTNLYVFTFAQLATRKG